MSQWLAELAVFPLRAFHRGLKMQLWCIDTLEPDVDLVRVKLLVTFNHMLRPLTPDYVRVLEDPGGMPSATWSNPAARHFWTFASSCSAGEDLGIAGLELPQFLVGEDEGKILLAKLSHGLVAGSTMKGRRKEVGVPFELVEGLLDSRGLDFLVAIRRHRTVLFEKRAASSLA